LPTHHRRAKLLKCLGSIEQARQLVDDYVYTYVYYSDKKEFVVDSQGLSSYKYIFARLLNKEYQASVFWNDHIKQSNADIFIYINDDVVLEINAIRRIVDIMSVYYPDLDGLVAITQDNIPTEQACMTAFGAIGAKFVDRFRNREVFCPEYKRFYLDSELGDYAIKYKKLYYSTDKAVAPLLTHYHPAFFKNMMDETHNEVRKYLSEDRMNYMVRKKKKLLWGDTFDTLKSIGAYKK
jgi:hypothetical protein